MFNAFTADVATGLSTAVCKDGQQTITANIPMGGYKFTGLAGGTATTDSATVGVAETFRNKTISDATMSGVTYTWTGPPTHTGVHTFQATINVIGSITAGTVVSPPANGFLATGTYVTAVTPPYAYNATESIQLTGTPVGRGMAAFTDGRTITGGVADHIHSYQAATLQINNNDVIDYYRGFFAHPVLNGSSYISDVELLSAYNPTGAGTLIRLYGLYVDDLTRGNTNYAIYTKGSAQVRFGGALNCLGVATISQATNVPSVVSQNSALITPMAHRFYHNIDTNDTNGIFWLADAGASVLRARLFSNGGLANYQANDVNLSDRNAKCMSDEPVEEQRHLFRKLSIKLGRYRDAKEEDDHLMFEAQQVEEVYPECVGIFDDGMRVDEETKERVRVREPLKGTYEHRILMRAYKTLQEHDDLIESLRAEVNILKGRH